jgi:hypothetical protein
METQAKRNAIADEAVGQRHEGAPPKTRQQDHDPSPEEVARRLAVSTGAQASISEKTAESIGERVANAYSDPDLARRPVSIGRGSARRISAPFELQHLLTLGTGFVLGYTAAVLLHSRIGTYFGRTPEPFQISKPPQGDRHPRRFVQSTVLKAITEHLQGMTAAEIIRELVPRNRPAADRGCARRACSGEKSQRAGRRWQIHSRGRGGADSARSAEHVVTPLKLGRVLTPPAAAASPSGTAGHYPSEARLSRGGLQLSSR